MCWRPSVAIVFLACAAGSATTPSKTANEQTAALLAKAADLTNITAQGSPPFRIRAEVKFSAIKTGTAVGTLTILWAAPDRIRRELVFPGYSEVDVLSHDKAWRTVKVPPLRSWQLKGLLDVSRPWMLQPKEKAKRARQIESDTGHTICVEFSKNWTKRELCVDAIGGFPVSVMASSGPDTIIYKDYALFSDKWLPRHMLLRRDRTDLVEVRVQSLDATAPDEGAFVPPAGAIPVPWCADLSPAKLVYGLSSYGAPDAQIRVQGTRVPKGSTTVYYLIGTDGHIHDPVVIESQLPEFDDALLKALKAAHYKPATCSGKPVEQEVIWSLGPVLP
jgi:TonB-like protein